MIPPTTIYLTLTCLNDGEVKPAQVSLDADTVAQFKCGLVSIATPIGICPHEHWHLTRPEAVAKAERMRLDEIDRLEKRLEQLRAMRFK